MKTSSLILAAALPMLLAACASTPDSLAHDDADRLFLKIAEIAQRPTPPTSRDMDEVDALASRLPSDGDLCALSKNVAVGTLNIDLALDSTLRQNGGNWTQQSAELRKNLKDTQNNSRGGSCGAFPPIAIN